MNSKKTRQIGSGVIISTVSEGSDSIVYQTLLPEGQLRAVKLFRTKSSPFRVDKKLLESIHHPLVVPVLGSGFYNGLPFLEQQWVSEPTLAELLSTRGAFPLEVCTSVGIMVCKALKALHQLNCPQDDAISFIHGNLRPSNVFLTKDGTIQVTDIGLSTPLAGKEKIEENDNFVKYCSPEKLKGKDSGVKEDIYSLGCILYELITGQAAFSQKKRKRLHRAKRKNRYRRLKRYKLKLPPQLIRLVESCMSKKAKKRPPSIANILEELSGIHLKFTCNLPEDVIDYFVNATEGRIEIGVKRGRVFKVLLTIGISVLLAYYGVMRINITDDNEINLFDILFGQE
ncbi:serine/threonine-protein kinase [Chitinispirillales bacterium ANBcel5]|uniref:serine/threonine protein kinase n=1 Tax=Cellulosispirillum alkaliphilum TaxID=3039283 RepID=UPI002A5023A8|nr:serine/threonine-protein kinase [Chitinispirillales bacterium ANBcel5]